MRLAFAMLARWADISRDGSFLHIMEGGIGGMLVPKLPIQLPMLCYVARVMVESESDQEFLFNVAIKDPLGKQLAVFPDQKVVTKISDLKDKSEDPAASIVMSMSGLPLLMEGRHTIELFINGNVFNTQTLNVKLTEQPPEAK